MSLTTVGVEWRPISDFSRSACLPLIMMPDLEVDDAVGAEAGDGLAGLRVERDQAVAGGDVDDAVVTLAVGPVGQAAARQLARRPARGALALVQAVGPLDLAGAPDSTRDHRAARAGGRIEHALDHDGRAFELGFGTRTEVVGLQAPRDFQLAEVGAVDLIERRVLRCRGGPRCTSATRRSWCSASGWPVRTRVGRPTRRPRRAAPVRARPELRCASCVLCS